MRAVFTGDGVEMLLEAAQGCSHRAQQQPASPDRRDDGQNESGGGLNQAAAQLAPGTGIFLPATRI